MTPEPASRRVLFRVALVAGLVGAAAGPAAGKGGPTTPGAALPPARPDLRVAKIPDLPTTISVPVSSNRSLVVSIPGRLFHQCPRNSTTATTFEGDGTILQNVWNTGTGNSHGLAYVGAFPLPASDPAVPFLDRAQRAAKTFVLGFRERYTKLELVRLAQEPTSIGLTKATVKVDGKPAPCWRTGTYATVLSGSGSGNKGGAPLTSEALLLPDPVTESLCYLIADVKGTFRFEQLLDGLSFRRTTEANPTGRIVSLNDISYGTDGRFPIRLGWYTSPAGFAPTQGSMRAPPEIVYGEERLDAAGVVTGIHRIEHRDRGTAVPSLEQQAATERSIRKVPADAPSRSVDLSPGAGRAIVFAWSAPVETRPATHRTAIFEVDDKLWMFTWTTFGDEALGKADDAAFDVLLHTVGLAVR